MIIYVTGDATQPEYGSTERLIIHVVNDVGGWGRGFVGSLSRRWPRAEHSYREWHRTGADMYGGEFKLGNIQPVRVDDQHIVVNMLAQKGYKSDDNPVPLSYEALACCLRSVKQLAGAFPQPPSIHAPKLGSGLAGGEWPKIVKLLDGVLKEYAVYIYNFEPLRLIGKNNNEAP